MIRRTAIAAVTVGVALSFTGCTATVSKSDLESQIKDSVTQDVGTPPDDVSCPDDLDAKVGATTHCDVTVKGTKIGVTLKVTSVDNKVAKFDVTLDDQPK